MEALDLLLRRSSSPRLGGSVPSAKKLETMFQAALRAPDHAQLRPWRFLIIEGDDRLLLGDLFARAQLDADPTLSAETLEKARQKPCRAPLLIIAIAVLQKHPKVPDVEQRLSAGAAVQNLLLAAYAQQVGAIWRTGSMAFNQTVMSGLNLQSNEEIIGFIYIGESTGKTRQLPEMNSEQYFEKWPITN